MEAGNDAITATSAVGLKCPGYGPDHLNEEEESGLDTT